MPYFAYRNVYVVVQTARVRNVGIDAFFKCEFCPASEVVALPVARAVGTFAPVFFYVVSVDDEFICGAFVEAGKVAAEHDKVGSHGEGKRYVIIVDYAAVGAHGNVNAGFFKIFVARFGNFNNGGGLSAPDTFLFACNANGAASYADLYKIRPGFG